MRVLSFLASGPLRFAAAILAISGCAVEPGPAGSSKALIMDQLHNGGTEGFLFLPPMVPKPAQLGDTLPELPVTVQVDELDGKGGTLRTVAIFTGESGPMGERLRDHLEGAPADPDDDDGDSDPLGFYLARWRTDDANLSLAAIYRVRVLVPARGGGTRQLGFADVDVVRDQKQFRGVDQNEYTPLVNGKTLRIKFRVDRPAVDWDLDGVFDWQDNCPQAANPDQRDSLGNGIGDACRCATRPADFGGIRCTAQFATCDAKGGLVLHDFAGKALERDGRIGVACTADSPLLDAKTATTVHSAALLVGCDGGVTFNVDPALGPGVQTATARAGDKLYSLRFDRSFGTDATPCSGGNGTCGRVRLDVHLAVEDLRAQGLANCRLYFTATATRGAGSIENGRLLGRGADYPILGFDGVRVTGPGADLACDLHPLDGKTIAGGVSRVQTRCASTAETAPPEQRLPTLCRNQSEARDTLEKSGFVDLHAEWKDARPAAVADIGRVGQRIGAICPGVPVIIDKAESFALPRPSGAAQVTARATLNAFPALVEYYKKSVDVSLAVAADGLPPLELLSVSVADLQNGVTLNVPPEYAKAPNPTTVVLGRERPGSLPAPVGADQIICFLEDGKFVCVIMDVDDGTSRVQSGGGPIEKLDLCLDVDVK